MDNSGILVKFSSFGESHGVGIGGVLSGIPSGVRIDTDFLKQEVQRRRGGVSEFSTPRKELDDFDILSGVFEGLTTGCPIGLFVRNSDVKSTDYSLLKDIFRPGHADYTYHMKYGVRDYRGGGRSSARETVVRVLAGGIAKLLLMRFDIIISSGVYGVGNAVSELYRSLDGLVSSHLDEGMRHARNSRVFAMDPSLEADFKQEILGAKRCGDSVGASVILRVENAPVGLGEPLYYKLDSALGSALLGINGVKAVEFGSGVMSSSMRGSGSNDELCKTGFRGNNSGGVLGGISSGQDILVRIHFKPTPSIFVPQDTVDIDGKEVVGLKLKGRHDPCIGIRGSVVCESVAALVISDLLLLNATSKLENLERVYNR